MLSSTVAYSSYIAPLPEDEPEVTLILNPEGSTNPNVPSILGVNIDWTDNANGLYDPISTLLSPVPVGELIGLDPSHMRFPASRLSQNYNWTKGVGKINERRANPTHGAHPQLSTFGTDEFYRLVNHTGSEAVMVVDAVHGSAILAADWVSYCNDIQYVGKGRDRSANGAIKPYGIQHWEIGNEAYLPNYWLDAAPGGDPAGKLYAQRLKAYSTKMKAVDPTIKVGAWLVVHPDKELTSADQSWNINFLTEASGKFPPRQGWDHVYYYDYVVVKVKLPGIDALLNPEDLYRYSYAREYESIRLDFAQLRGLLKSYSGFRPNGIPIAIASFEPDFGVEGWNTQAPSQAGSSLLTADLAMQFIAQSMDGTSKAIEYACYGELNTPHFSSLMINPDFDEAHIDEWQRSPNYLPYSMAIELQGRKLVPIGELDVPTFSVTGEKDLPAVKNVPIISSVASSKGNDGPLSIMMINRDLDRSVSCRITIEGWSGRLNLTVQKLTFESLLSTNLADMDVSIKTADRTVGGPNITISIGPASVLLLTVERGGS
jgi:hypothetical protein